MTRVDIVYATKTGCTREICADLADRIGEAGHEPVLHEADSAPAPDGETVVLASGVRMGAWHPQAVRWARQHAEALRRSRLASLTVCLDVLEGETGREKALVAARKALQPLSLAPAAEITLPGRMVIAEYGFLERQVMRKVAVSKGVTEGSHRDPTAEGAAAEQVITLCTAPD